VGDNPANLDAIRIAKVPNMVRKRLDADLGQITQAQITQ
ncbi:pseudoazurin, partial [Rhizobium ruizarguesonis]